MLYIFSDYLDNRFAVRSLDHFIYIVTLLWASVILLMSMIYQLDFVQTQIGEVIYGVGNNHTRNCTAQEADAFSLGFLHEIFEL